jgi:nicotinamide phosphoribosyltransferase
MKLMPILFKDGYKTDHRRQYPEGTEFVYSNLTPRSTRDPRYKAVVVFGIQAFVKDFLIERFHRDFFDQPKDEVIAAYKRRMDNYLGPDSIPTDHIAALHDLKYLPLLVKSLPEGTLCPIGVPYLTITNTIPEFFWLTNCLETLMSCEIWKAITNATIAFEYRKVLQAAAMATNPGMSGFVPWQGHDFSFRGMDGVESAARSGAAHLLSFTGSDTIPAIDYLEHFYGADSDKECVAGSVPATEHSVMSMGGEDSEIQTFNRLITKIYPRGIVSIVSDTWDYWDTITNKATALKSVIMGRDGKVVFRPDSGDPVKIICGDQTAPIWSPQYHGSIRVLWDIFGGTVTSKGYKQLDPHVGLIYGDSITIERCEEILAGLEARGFASTNVVLGVGSYTYQYNTRDTFGMAMKATHGQINGIPKDIFKSPKTDSGSKLSAKGWLRVNDNLTLSQQVTREQEATGLLQPIFQDGKLMRDEKLCDIRKRLLSTINAM